MKWQLPLLIYDNKLPSVVGSCSFHKICWQCFIDTENCNPKNVSCIFAVVNIFTHNRRASLVKYLLLLCRPVVTKMQMNRWDTQYLDHSWNNKDCQIFASIWHAGRLIGKWNLTWPNFILWGWLGISQFTKQIHFEYSLHQQILDHTGSVCQIPWYLNTITDNLVWVNILQRYHPRQLRHWVFFGVIWHLHLGKQRLLHTKPWLDCN